MADAKTVLLLQLDTNLKQAVNDLAETKKAIADLMAQQKSCDKSTADGRVQFESLGVTIRALNQLKNEQQKTIDNTVKAQQAEKESSVQLKAQLSNLTLEYSKLSKEQQKSADGIALKDSIKGITDSLKGTEEGLGIFNRNVGDYKNKILEAMGLNPSFAKSLAGIGISGKETAGVLAGEGVQGVQAFGKSLLSLLANPVVLVIAAIAAAIMLVKSAIDSNGEATNTLNRILSPFKELLTVILTALGQLVSWFLKGVEAIEAFTLSIMKHIPLLDKLAEKSQQAMELEKAKQRLAAEGRVNMLANAKDEDKIAELRNQSRQRDKFSIQDRIKILQEADALEIGLLTRKQTLLQDAYNERLKEMKNEGKAYKDLTSDEKTALVQMQVDIVNAHTEYERGTMRIHAQTSNLIIQETNEQKAANKKALDDHKQIMEQRLELTKQVQKAELDLYNLQKTSISENLKSIFNDDTKNYSIRYQAAVDYEKQTSDLINKRADYEISSSDLISKLGDAKRNKDGQSVLLYEKLIADQTKIIRTKQANDLLALKTETDKTLNDIEKKQLEESIKNIQTNTAKEQAVLAEETQVELSELSIRYAYGKIKKDQYEKEKLAITDKYHKADLDITLDNLNKELMMHNLSKDQRESIEKAIADTKKKYATQASNDEIKANENAAKKIEEREKKLTELKKQLYQQLATTLKDIGDGIFDSEIQRYDDEQQKVTDTQTAEKAAVDDKEKSGVLTSKQATAEKDKIDADSKVKSDALEAQKKKATRDKAIFDRGISIFNIGLSTGEAIMKAVAEFPITGGLPFSLIVAAIGALQIASVLAAPLPTAGMGRKLIGNSHANGGVNVNAEGGEWIINKRASAMFDPLLAMINGIGNGEFSDYGYAARETSMRAIGNANQSIIANGINTVSENTSQDGGAIEKLGTIINSKKIYLSIEDYRKADQSYTTIENIAKL